MKKKTINLQLKEEELALINAQLFFSELDYNEKLQERKKKNNHFDTDVYNTMKQIQKLRFKISNMQRNQQ